MKLYYETRRAGSRDTRVESSNAGRMVPTSMAMLVSLDVGFLVVNGLIMLAVPRTWYDAVPGLHGTGLFNGLFIRGVGMVKILLAAAFWLGLIRPALRTGVWGAATVWLVAHATFQAWEMARTICSASSPVRDSLVVTLPALIGVIAATWSWRAGRRAR